MSTRISIRMTLFKRTIVLFSCLIACSLQAQSRKEADSGRAAVQHFYDWYVPRAANSRGRDMLMVAAVNGPLRFDHELVRWLRIDSIAQARATGEIDGLDGDPYLNAQDPCDVYT